MYNDFGSVVGLHDNITCPNGWKFALNNFGDCLDEPRKYVGFGFGVVEMIIWAFALVPQICLNFKNKHCGAFSFSFLICWFVGDALNLVTVIIGEQLRVLAYVAIVYLIMDFMLAVQFKIYGEPNNGRGVVLPAVMFGTMFLQQSLTPSAPDESQGRILDDTDPTLQEMPKTSSMIAGYCIISTLTVAFYITGRYIQIKKNIERQSCDYLSPTLFCCSIAANICTLFCVGLQVDLNDLVFYILIHTPSLIFALICIPLDGYILHQIYKFRPGYQLFQNV